jgi:hypothetical protein
LIACCNEHTKTLKDVIIDTKNEVSNVVDEAKKENNSNKKKGGSGGNWQEALLEMNKNIRTLLSKSTGGGGGDEGGGGGGLGFASAHGASRAFSAEMKASTKTLENGLPAFEEFFTLFSEGAGAQFNQNMLAVNKKLIDFGRTLMDIGGAARKTMGSIEEMFKAGQGGMIDITALYEDLGAGLIKNRDALSATLPVVQKFAEKQKLLIGTLGTNLEDVARSFKENREAAKEAFGNDFLERIPFDELNAIQTTMLEQQRRAGVKATNAEILTSQDSRNQMQLLKDISFATGKTVEEIINLQEEAGMTLAELKFNGLISEQQLKSMTAQKAVFDTQGIGSLNTLMMDIAEAGGIEGFKGKEGVPLMMMQGNNEALIREMYKITQGGAGETPEGMQRMIELSDQLEGLSEGARVSAELRGDNVEIFKNLADLGNNATRIISAQEAIADRGGDATLQARTKLQKETEGGPGGTIQGMFNTVREMITNNLGAGGALVMALAANTAAIIWNTMTRTKGGMKMLGGAGKLLKKLPGVGKLMGIMGIGGLTAAAMNPATAGAEAGADKILKGTKLSSSLGPTDGTAKKVAGKSTAKFAGKAGAKSLLKKIPVIGLLAGLGFAVGRLMDGDFVGAGMEVASGAASLAPGFGTAASFALDAGLAARDMGAFDEGVGVPPVSDTKGIDPSSGDKATVAPAGVRASSTPTAVNATTAYGQLVAQTMHLASLVSLTTQGNVVRQEILDLDHGKISPSGKPSWLSTLGRDRPLSAAYTPLLDDAAA